MFGNYVKKLGARSKNPEQYPNWDKFLDPDPQH